MLYQATRWNVNQLNSCLEISQIYIAKTIYIPSTFNPHMKRSLSVLYYCKFTLCLLLLLHDKDSHYAIKFPAYPFE